MDAEWQKNATTWASVPSHPLGEVSIFRYISGELETEGISRGRAQGRLHGFQIILASDTITSLIFAHNLYLVLKILVKQPRNFIAWCCLGTALLGVIPGIMIWLAAIADLFNCSQIGFYYIFAIIVSLVLSDLALLQRAYLSQRRQTWVLIVGALTLLPYVGVAVIAFGYSYTKMEEEHGCVVNYPPSLPYLWFGGMVPVNLLFGGIFCHVAYRQYRMFGTDAWKRLARDGIQAMCVVTICNLITGICIFAKIGGGLSELFFVLDWLVSSTIMVHHCDSTRRTATSASSHPSRSRTNRTSYIDIKETITTYHGRIATNTEFASFY